jgi:hypothetical protein
MARKPTRRASVKSKKPIKLPAGDLADALYADKQPKKKLVVYDRSDMNVSTPAERIKLTAAGAKMLGPPHLKQAAEALGFLEILNSGARRARRELYFRRIAHGANVTRIVSEGDSWHLYPHILEEIIDQLNKDESLAIYSTDGAGDTIADMWKERAESFRGFERAIDREKPKIFLLSAGANDLLGARPGPGGKQIGGLYFHLKDYQSGMTPRDLLKPSIDGEIKTAIELHRQIIGKAQNFSSVKKTIVHSYDYAFPDGDIWLGQPMAKRGVPANVQRGVVIELLDRFHDKLAAVAQSLDKPSSRVICVDTRNTVTSKSDWHDELHPKSRGFAAVAAKIKARI